MSGIQAVNDALFYARAQNKSAKQAVKAVWEAGHKAGVRPEDTAKFLRKTATNDEWKAFKKEYPGAVSPALTLERKNAKGGVSLKNPWRTRLNMDGVRTLAMDSETYGVIRVSEKAKVNKKIDARLTELTQKPGIKATHESRDLLNFRSALNTLPVDFDVRGDTLKDLSPQGLARLGKLLGLELSEFVAAQADRRGDGNFDVTRGELRAQRKEYESRVETKLAKLEKLGPKSSDRRYVTGEISRLEGYIRAVDANLEKLAAPKGAQPANKAREKAEAGDAADTEAAHLAAFERSPFTDEDMASLRSALKESRVVDDDEIMRHLGQLLLAGKRLWGKVSEGKTQFKSKKQGEDAQLEAFFATGLTAASIADVRSVIDGDDEDMRRFFGAARLAAGK